MEKRSLIKWCGLEIVIPRHVPMITRWTYWLMYRLHLPTIALYLTMNDDEIEEFVRLREISRGRETN